MKNKIEITKEDILQEIKLDLISDLTEEFFDWMHGSGCDAVEEGIFREINKNILERLSNDKKFLDGVKEALIKDLIKSYEPSELISLVEREVIKDVTKKLLNIDIKVKEQV